MAPPLLIGYFWLSLFPWKSIHDPFSRSLSAIFGLASNFILISRNVLAIITAHWLWLSAEAIVLPALSTESIFWLYRPDWIHSYFFTLNFVGSYTESDTNRINLFPMQIALLVFLCFVLVWRWLWHRGNYLIWLHRDTFRLIHMCESIICHAHREFNDDSLGRFFIYVFCGIDEKSFVIVSIVQRF